MKHLISTVDRGSIAEELGILPGAFLIGIDGHEVEDIIDYEALTACGALTLEIEQGGESFFADIEKDVYEPLGLGFDTGLMSSVRSCRNRCVFCFIDQMPRGGRETLHFKDDDWRLSLIMGNYVTLTNVSDAEFERIIERRAYPLYISVHSTDGELRKTMMGNPSAVRLMERLERLARENMTFHSQIVICPGINDGKALESTLGDLYALRPAAASLALVPVGLTKHRAGLYPLRALTPEEASRAIDAAEMLNAKSIADSGVGFAYAADEMYMIAGRELPKYEDYGPFAQIENGVGLLRRFEHDFLEALDEMQAPPSANATPLRLCGACGESAYSFMRRLFALLEPKGICLELMPVKNSFFGDSVTVSGLVTGGDIVRTLHGRLSGRPLVIPDDMLREREDVFLDGMRLIELEQALGSKVYPLSADDGGAFIDGLTKLIYEVRR